MKPILPFKAVEEGKVYPTMFETDKELPAEMEPIALELGCLSDEDAQSVRDRLDEKTDDDKAAADDEAAKDAADDKTAKDADGAPGEEEAAPAEKAQKKPRGKAKSAGAAPENKGDAAGEDADKGEG